MYIDESLRYISAIQIDPEDPKRVRPPQFNRKAIPKNYPRVTETTLYIYMPVQICKKVPPGCFLARVSFAVCSVLNQSFFIFSVQKSPNNKLQQIKKHVLNTLFSSKVLSTGATLHLGPIRLHVENWECRALKSSARCQKFGVPCRFFFSACKWDYIFILGVC